MVIEPNELSDTDEEEEVEVSTQQKQSDSFFIGKDGTKWNKNEPNAAVLVRQHNIMRFRSGPRLRSSIPIEVFKNFFTLNIAFIIITETNKYIEKMQFRNGMKKIPDQNRESG